MHRVRLLFIVTLFLKSSAIFAQQKVAISGVVRDTLTGETLIGAVIQEPQSGIGTMSDSYGLFSLELPGGTHVLNVSYAGYKKKMEQIEVTSGKTLNIMLQPVANGLKEVVVSSENGLANVQKQRLTVQTIKSLPAFLGEPDVLKAIQTLPSVKAAGDGNSGFYVRGGGTDQNLILLDEAIVYNPSHLLGFFSTFNTDMLKDVSLYTGFIPVMYGGRLSSVIDIRTKDGNNQIISTSGGIGLLGAKLQLEVPVKKNKGSFILSGRRSFVDALNKLAANADTKNNTIYYYDINAKANYTLNDKNRVYLSFYAGNDVLKLGDVFGLKWGNTTFTLRWNHLFTDKLFLNTSVISSNFRYAIGMGNRNDGADFIASIQDHSIKEDFTWHATSSHTIAFGLQFTNHKFNPGQIQKRSDSSPYNEFSIDKQFANEYSLYATDEMKLSGKLSAEIGLRYSFYHVIGAGKSYTFSDPDAPHPTDTQVFTKGQTIAAYGNAEPRILLKYAIDENNLLNLGYSRTTQNIHLASNSTSSFPTDLWISTSKYIKPELADIVSAGYFHTLMNNGITASVELYYKKLQHQIDFRNGAQMFANPYYERDIVLGKGEAYGTELLIKKTKGKTTGWIGYSLSWSKRQFDEINNGRPFYAKNDRRHNINIVITQKISTRLEASAAWIYATGNAVSFPVGRMEFDGQNIPIYTERNGYRMPDYHRLDLSLTLLNKPAKKYRTSWNFSVYNAYARQNTWAYTFRQSEEMPKEPQLYKLYLFGIVPSITYNFKF
jgi:hypothetical protein